MKRHSQDDINRIDKGWMKMEEALQHNMPKSDRRRRFFVWFFGMGIGIGMLGFYLLYDYKSNDLEGLNKIEQMSLSQGFAELDFEKNEGALMHETPAEANSASSTNLSLKKLEQKDASTMNRKLESISVKEEKWSNKPTADKSQEEGIEVVKTSFQNADQTYIKSFDKMNPNFISANPEKSGRTIATNENVESTTVEFKEGDISDQPSARPIVSMDILPKLFGLELNKDNDFIIPASYLSSPIERIIPDTGNKLWNSFGFSIAAAALPQLDGLGISTDLFKSWSLNNSVSLRAKLGYEFGDIDYFVKNKFVVENEEVRIEAQTSPASQENMDSSLGGVANTEDEMVAAFSINEKRTSNLSIGLDLIAHHKKAAFFFGLGADYFVTSRAGEQDDAAFGSQLEFAHLYSFNQLIPYAEVGLEYALSGRIDVFTSYKYNTDSYFSTNSMKLRSSRIKMGIHLYF